MGVHYKLFILLSVSCLCDGHLQRLGGFLSDAHHQIHTKVNDVAGAVIGGFGSIIGGRHFGHHGHDRPHGYPPTDNGANGGNTVFVIVEGTSPDNGGQPHTPYRPPPQYPPPSNHGFNPNRPYHHYPNPNQAGYNGQRPHQPNNYGNEHPGNQFPENPYINENFHGNNGNSHEFNGNGNYYQDSQGKPNNPNHNGNEFTNPEQNKPNEDNYKPTETYNDQLHNAGHVAENTDRQANDKTTKKPTSDGPLLVPLNDYTYGGDKIAVNAPKREADKAEENDDDFPIDIRFKDE